MQTSGSQAAARGAGRILIAAANDALRGMLGDALRRDGYSVTEVASGEQLLHALKGAQGPAGRLDLVVCDQRLPGITALEALERATDAGCRFPVLLMTAQRDPGLMLRAGRLNVAAVFRKPFEFDDLRTAVLWLMPKSRRGLH